MDNFEYYAPTRVIFGKDTEAQTGAEAKRLGASKALLVYGGGSVVKSGLLGRVKDSLDAAGVAYAEYGGAQPNPLLSHAEEGAAFARGEGADLIIAVGGGSAIDTAKAIAHGAANPGIPLWDFWTKKVPLTKTLPVGAVVTIPAAGSEMSDSAVLTNTGLHKKAGLSTDHNRCRFAIMNPALVFTLPKYQLAAGITDIMMHTMERYFIPDIKCDLTDEIAEGLLRSVIRNGRLVMREENYDAMAEIMWANSLSHNGLTECGRGKDFSVHKFGHALSARYGVTHGASLAAVWRAWADYLHSDCTDRFARYARRVWNVAEEDDLLAAKEGIRVTVDFFREIGMPACIGDLSEVSGLTDEDIHALALDATMNGTVTLTRITAVGVKEAEEILRAALS